MPEARRFLHATECLDLVASMLQEREAEHNLALGVLAQCAREPHNPEFFYGAILEQDKPELVMVRTDQNLILAGRETHIPEAVNLLQQNNIPLTGIVGPRATVLAFAEHWQQVTGATWQIQMDQLIYQLDELVDIPLSSGHLRNATLQDREVLIHWVHDFYLVAGENVSETEAEKQTDKYIGDQSLYVWEDEGIVSMVKQARPTPNGIVVNFVYTPPALRGRGYASSCVYTLSQMLLRQYRFCALYTDRSNPTSNGIYARMGYRPVAESAWVKVVEG